jgi:sugar/nucleoside kinase (ribokinase family)
MVDLPAYDYLAVGHVTVDIMPDGSPQAGGTVLYGALQAARMGLQALVVTRGVPGEVRELLSPFASEFDLDVQPAAETTTLQTSVVDGVRRQRVLAWAGEMRELDLPRSRVLHLAPVAAELSGLVQAQTDLVGLTPQGLVRYWPSPGGEIEMRAPSAGRSLVASGCSALVISEQERRVCAAMTEATLAGGGVVAITAAHRPTELLTARGTLSVPVQEITEPVDDMGAGDVWASAFFVELAGGADPAAAARTAAAAAALRVQGSGPAAVPDGRAIAARLAAT